MSRCFTEKRKYQIHDYQNHQGTLSGSNPECDLCRPILISPNACCIICIVCRLLQWSPTFLRRWTGQQLSYLWQMVGQSRNQKKLSLFSRDKMVVAWWWVCDWWTQSVSNIQSVWSLPLFQFSEPGVKRPTAHYRSAAWGLGTTDLLDVWKLCFFVFFFTFAIVIIPLALADQTNKQTKNKSNNSKSNLFMGIHPIDISP